MNGNANLNANNLTPQNVIDWQEKLNLRGGRMTASRTLVSQNVVSLPEITLTDSMLNYDFLLIYAIVDDSYRIGGALYPPEFVRYNNTSASQRLVIANDSQYLAFYSTADNKIKIQGKSSGANWLVIRGYNITTRTN